MATILALSISAFLSLVIMLSVVCLLTGNMPRSYFVLSPSASLIVAGRTTSVDQLASFFQPQLFQPAVDNSPPILTMWWEAIDAGNSVALVYHPVWQDERHPNAILHWIYYIYRAIVYGIPVRDIEYIQISVNKSDGSIRRIRYEGSSSTSYQDWLSEHVYITIDQSGDQYIETAIMKNSESSIGDVHVDGHHLHFGIVNWSHQFIFLESSSEGYTVPVSAPLEYLTEENYAMYKLAQRSQGDFTTEVGKVGRIAKSAMGVLILGLPYLFSKYKLNWSFQTGERG